MATDSSSGTLPSSSRLTIDSSSSIARSKESFFTSIWVFSTIARSRVRPMPSAESNEFLRAHCGGNSRSHQRRDVGRDRFLEPLEVVAAFQHRDNPAAGACLCNIHQLARDPAEILRVQVKRCQGIAMVCVEAGRDD